MNAYQRNGRIIAVLGPTNTGKTHYAIERLLGHASGMIGFPLRLLARENYERMVAVKGRSRVALITGEEKIIPRGAVYFVCTVESMPLDRPVDCLAIDEIQLAADQERGHVFTHRLLHARGHAETLFLGAETIRPMIRQLVPEAQFIGRPRLSELTHIGAKKLTRLPRRSAVVAFSTNDVYHLAEHIRRQRGGTAVVLGALSPRTRNAQVGLFQAGEVDYLVATDAIGMGLNMDIDHVAFARLRKFDGIRSRPLQATEVAQIAGRAGRHMADGTFGTVTGALDDQPLAIPADIVERVEGHEFEPLRHLMWRNYDLDFSTPRGLLHSLEARPSNASLRRAPEADDHMALSALVRDPAIARHASTIDRVRLLWEVCQIPDFRKVMSDHHARLLARVFDQLVTRDGRLDQDWVAGQIRRLDRTEGDIDALVSRLAHIRTWTFITHRAAWLDDPLSWQERTRQIEDTLSDALHARLTQRFVDKRVAVLTRGLETGLVADAAVDGQGLVTLADLPLGRLTGFTFVPDLNAGLNAGAGDQRALMATARRALQGEIDRRLARLEAAPDEALRLADDGTIVWHDEALARLSPGEGWLEPRLTLSNADLLEAPQRDRVLVRLRAWWTAHRAAVLAPLLILRDPDLTGAARGLAFRLFEAGGWMERRALSDVIGRLSRADRQALASHGVRLGRLQVYAPALLKPAPRGLIATLRKVHDARLAGVAVPKPGAGLVDLGAPPAPELLRHLGFVPVGPRAVRVDRLETLALAADKRGRQAPFVADLPLAQTIGLKLEELPAALRLIGYRPHAGPDGQETWRRARAKGRPKAAKTAAKRAPGVDDAAAKGQAGQDQVGQDQAGKNQSGKNPARRDKRARAVDPDNPFAKLRHLKLAR